MAVLSAALAYAGAADNDGDKGITEYRETYNVVTDGAATRQPDVLAAVPGIGAAHPDVAGATLRRRSPRQTAPTSWTVELLYSDELGDKGATPSDPLSWPAQWSLGFDTREEGLYKVPGSDPVIEVKNTANDVFDPQPTAARYLAVLSVEKNISFLSLGLVRATVGKTNSGIFLSQPAKQVLCRSIRGNGPKFYDQVAYASVTFEFLMDRDSHVIKLLSQGYNFLDPDAADSLLPVPILDGVNHRPITSPQNLNADGEVTSGDAEEVTFDRFEPTGFGVFGLSLSNLQGLST